MVAGAHQVSVRGRRFPAWTMVGATVLLVAAVMVAVEGDARARSDTLPDSMAGLASQQDGPSGAAAEALADRLRRDPAVAAVAVGLYGSNDGSLVVMALSPTTPFTEQTAGELTARVLGVAGGRRATTDEVTTQTSEDGRAVITCSTPREGTSTCVTVEPDTALLVVTKSVQSPVTDPVDLASRVRDEVLAAG